MLVIEKFPGASTLEVTRDVEDALAAMAPGLGGIDADPTIFRPATFIESALDHLGATLLVAGCCCCSRSERSCSTGGRVAVTLVSLPLSLVAAGLVLVLRGETMNAMVLAGLVLAVVIVVDDAVAATESVRTAATRAPRGVARSHRSRRSCAMRRSSCALRSATRR